MASEEETRWRVACDRPGCRSAGPWRETIDQSAQIARRFGWHAPANGEGGDYCPRHLAPSEQPRAIA